MVVPNRAVVVEQHSLGFCLNDGASGVEPANSSTACFEHQNVNTTISTSLRLLQLSTRAP
jgi:hypothetical protein